MKKIKCEDFDQANIAWKEFTLIQKFNHINIVEVSDCFMSTVDEEYNNFHL
jgi:hypothetical protein